MLRKIEKLTSIGKFKSYVAVGDVSLKRLSLIYGDNGSGKTTLAAVLRSLAEDRPELIQRRASIGTPTQQRVEMIERDASGTDTNHVFDIDHWSKPLNGIEVFDIHFVNDNVYSGFAFSDEHKKQLHDFVVGAQAVELRARIEENKAKKQQSRQDQVSLQSRIVEQIQNGMRPELVNACLEIEPHEADGIAQRLAQAEVNLRNARSNSVIQTLQSLAELPKISLGTELDKVATDLPSSLQTIEDRVLRETFMSHCADLKANGVLSPEPWIKVGVDYLAKTGQAQRLAACPFCGRSLEGDLSLIRAYALHFDKMRNELVTRLNGYLSSLRAVNLQAVANDIDTVIRSNVERVASWKEFVPTEIRHPRETGIAAMESVHELLAGVIESLHAKCGNPSVSVANDKVVQLQSALESANQAIDAYNQEVDAFNTAIATLKVGLRTEEVAQSELDSLKRIQRRFAPDVSPLCNDLLRERERLRALEEAYPGLIKQQEQAAAQFFSSYKDRVNHYLSEVFRTPFRIEDVVHVPPRGRATQSRIDYKLTIDGKAISFDINSKLSTRDCLSEGDKSTIALAFFLSKMDIDPAKTTKIIVIDDPLSSFDSGRRANTVRIIQNMVSEFDQVIVLSHNEQFLKAISDRIAKSDKKALRISEDLVQGCCTIELLDLDSLVEIDYFKNIKELEEFLRNPDPGKIDHVVGLLRNVLEAHLLFRFYKVVRNIPSTMRTFGRLIDELERQGVQFRNDTVPPSVIPKLRMMNSVSWKPHHGEPKPTLPGSPMSLTPREVTMLIQDTMDLIDNRI